jgi:SAM-dependent methyltransferase
MHVAGDLRDWWVTTGHRRRLTKEIAPRVAGLRGLAVDVGGGRDAPHDQAWTSTTRRWRLDIEPRRRPDLCADAALLPFSDGSVDAVTMFEILEHLPDPGAAIDEAHRVLVDGGTFLGSAPFVWPTHGDPGDYFRFGADGLRHLLRAFSDLELTPIGNATSSAWVLLSSSSRTWRVLNPVLRLVGGRGDSRCPEGWVFRATR